MKKIIPSLKLNLLQNIYYLIAIVFIIVCLFLGSIYIRHNDIYFFTDIARDFLLLEEIALKKIVLIGPRASAIDGLFHGPLWLYLNFPAFWLGQGNPVFIGWYWLFLVILFLITTFFLIKSLTNKNSALIYIMLLAGFLITWIYRLYNPLGAFFMMPIFIFSFYQYLKTKKFKFLLLHFFISGLIIQFQMAVGGPLLILSLLWLIKFMRKNNILKHLVAIFILALPLSSFVIFELRHSFAQLNSVIRFVTNKGSAPHTEYISRLGQRISLITLEGISLISEPILRSLNIVASYLIVLYVFSKNFLLETKENLILKICLYFYIGFYAVSLFFNGDLLYHYWMPVIPLAFLIFVIVIKQTKLKIKIPILIIIFFIMIQGGLNFNRQAKSNIGMIEDDWQFQTQLAQKIFSDGSNEFGYFIITPDIYAYESKYAMSYYTKLNPQKNVYIYTKKPITYIIIAPNPSFRPDISYNEWKKSKLKIYREADQIFNMNGDYIIEKYLFNDEEIAQQPDSGINDWIYFR